MKLKLERGDLNLLLFRLNSENNISKLEKDLEKASSQNPRLAKLDIEMKIKEIKNTGLNTNKYESLFDSKVFNRGFGPEYFIGIKDCNEFGKKFQSMVIAHEIDHYLRFSWFKKIFKTTLYDELISPFNFNDKILEEHLNLGDKLFNRVKEEKKNRIGKSLAYFRNPLEILARMTQLKNFLSFRADEKFLIDDFKYVKENYIKSFGKESELVKFQIAWFLNSIKDEEKFIQNMNEFWV